jgi:hypothetical protein
MATSVITVLLALIVFFSAREMFACLPNRGLAMCFTDLHCLIKITLLTDRATNQVTNPHAPMVIYRDRTASRTFALETTQIWGRSFQAACFHDAWKLLFFRLLLCEVPAPHALLESQN